MVRKQEPKKKLIDFENEGGKQADTIIARQYNNILFPVCSHAMQLPFVTQTLRLLPNFDQQIRKDGFYNCNITSSRYEKNSFTCTLHFIDIRSTLVSCCSFFLFLSSYCFSFVFNYLRMLSAVSAKKAEYGLSVASPPPPSRRRLRCGVVDRRRDTRFSPQFFHVQM